MGFKPEPKFVHGTTALKTGILLINLGTPDAPTKGAVRKYLKEFLSDRRVIEIPRLVWMLILYLFILPTRASRSAEKYEKVWTKDGSPLLYWTQRQAKLLRGALGARALNVQIEVGMRYGNPSIADALDRLKAAGAVRILCLPLYPQYSGTTTASCYDAVAAWCAQTRNVPEIRWVKHYHDDVGYINALAASVREFREREGLTAWMAPPGSTSGPTSSSKIRMIMSFHGLPARNLTLGDPYYCECMKTGRLLAEKLGFAEDEYSVSFQSRFGRARWLEPYTAPLVKRLAAEGAREIEIICPGFPADCLETLEEISMEVRADFIRAGGKDFHYIACLNDSQPWIVALAAIAERHMAGWPPTQEKSPQESAAQAMRARAHGAKH